MNGKKKFLAMAVLCAVASVGFVLPASAEETMQHDLDEVIVEADRDALPGGFIANNDRVGILGNIKAIDVPFTQKKYTEKTIMTFYDPNQPLNGVLANSPSIRVGSPSPMYTDFSMRGVNMNASHYYINGIPNMFNQTRSIPTYVLSSVDIVSGPNTVLNGATFSNNGTNGTDAPAGLLNGTTKRATTDPVTRYTQRFSGRSTWTEDLDVGRRFGKNNEWGIRVNAHNEDGGLSMEGADVRDKSIYINLDHQDVKSTTNLFGGYYDWKVDGGQRWLSASGVKAGKLADAPDGKNNLSFDGQTKYNHGMLFTLNHIQKFSDKWSGFINGGYGHYSEHKYDPNSGSLTLGDPAEFVLNQDGLYAPSEEQLEAMREELGLNKPLWLRYGLWLMGVLQGDLGSSYITGRDIAAEIAQRLPVTLELAVLALLMAGVGGIFFGSICAVYRGSFFDNFVKNLTNVMLSIPGFWLALILILIFSEQLRWLPTSGTGSLKYFLLPAFVLAFATMATVCRFMRGALLTEFGRQYFLVAKVRGINKFNLLTRYALPNAIIPVIALLGNYFASVLGGSVIAESIFAIPGISSMALEAIRYRDYPVLQAYVLVSGCTLILVMVTVDLLIAYLNPKIKLGERS